jgi:hypothetical protein
MQEKTSERTEKDLTQRRKGAKRNFKQKLARETKVSRADTDWGISIFCTSSVGCIALCFCCYDLSSKIHLGVFAALREVSCLYKRLGVGPA